MAAQMIKNGCGALRRTHLLRYIVNRFASGDEPSASLVHDDIFVETGIKDRRTWLKHLHGLEADRFLEVCYGKNQYALTVVRPGKMLWQYDRAAGQGYGDHGRGERLPDTDAETCFRGVPGVTSQKHCRTATVGSSPLSSKKTDVQYFAMAPGKNAMARESAMAFSADGLVPRQGRGKGARTKRSQDFSAMACVRVEADASTRPRAAASPVGNFVNVRKTNAILKHNAMAKSENAMASGSAMAFSVASGVPWHENAIALSSRLDSGSKLIFDKIVYFSDLGAGVYFKNIYNLQESSKDSKIINLTVGSVLSSKDGGRLSEKRTHTQVCADKTREGRRKEKEGGGQLTAAKTQTGQSGGRVYSAAHGTPTDATAMTGDAWYRWAVETAHTIHAAEDEFVDFARKWLNRSMINGKFAMYKTHSIKDFILQDYNRWKQERRSEAAMRGAIAMAAAPMPPLHVPNGVKLDGVMLSRKEKIAKLRGIAENYRYYIDKVLRGEQIGIGDLIGLHDLFLLNIPYYAQRWQQASIEPEEAASKWIYFQAQRGYTAQGILQQVGFC